MRITLLGNKQARLGYTFLFCGAAKICKKCRFYLPCLGNLEAGRVYTVTKILEKEFPCPLCSKKERVVEIEEAPVKILVNPKSGIPGAIIKIDFDPCERSECKNRVRCFPLGLIAGDRCKVIEIRNEVECYSKPRLVEALVRREDLAS